MYICIYRYICIHINRFDQYQIHTIAKLNHHFITVDQISYGRTIDAITM